MSRDRRCGFSGGDEAARLLAQRVRQAKAARRADRRQEGRGGLTINSMMDIMTIILVFLINSYGDNPLLVKSSPDLQISRSTTELSPEDTMQITITRKAIIVGDRMSVAVKDGEWDRSAKLGSRPMLFIPPLFDRLTEEVSRHKQMSGLTDEPFDGVVTIVADRTTPAHLINEVVYTAGQAELKGFKFATIKFGRGDEVKRAARGG